MTIANKVLELDEQLEIIGEKVNDQAGLIDLVKSALDGLPDKNGIDTSNATATNEDLIHGKTAFANGQKLVGTAKTYDEGYHKGHSDGYQEGLSSGQEDVYNDGYNDGYNIGFDEGSSDGHRRGYDEGIAITNDATAIASHILDGDIAYVVGGERIEGTMPDNGAVSQTLNTSTTSFTIPEGYHNGEGKVSISTQFKVVNATSKQQAVFPDDGKVLSSVIITANDAFKPENIKAGVKISSTETGTFTSDATATAADIIKDKSAYVNGQKLVGTYEPIDPIDLTGTTWMFNENVRYPATETLKTFNIDFVSSGNNLSFSKISFQKNSTSGFYDILYKNSSGGSFITVFNSLNNKWLVNIDVKIITITGGTDINNPELFKSLSTQFRLLPSTSSRPKNLTNTTWVFNTSLGNWNGSSRVFKINFISNSILYDSISFSSMAASLGSDSNYTAIIQYFNSSDQSSVGVGPNSSSPYTNTIFIIGGEDVNNTDLIGGLKTSGNML